MSFIFIIIFSYIIYSYLLKNFHNKNYSEISQGDFELNLLVLSAFVIKSDGKVDKKELDFVRNYFIKLYGENNANIIFKKFKNIVYSNNMSISKVCDNLKNIMPYATKLQLLHYLFEIAKSDNEISDLEVNTIRKISDYLFVNIKDFISIKYMFETNNSNNLNSAYSILEVTESSSNDEIKESYRKLAKLHHPDKVQYLGEKYIKGAKEKFSKIQNAYEIIKKERGF